jgi:S1-C subfamily serine protease
MVRGRVVDLEGAPVSGLEVATDSVRGDESDSQSITDDAGRFELPRLPVGMVSITVGPATGQASPFGAVRIAVDVAPDQRVIELAAIRVARRRIAVGGARGDLGFTIVPGKVGADPLLAALKVETVRYGGPAASGGLRLLDEIVAVDGQDVRGMNRSLYATMTEVPAGTVLKLGLARGVTVQIVAGKRR